MKAHGLTASSQMHFLARRDIFAGLAVNTLLANESFPGFFRPQIAMTSRGLELHEEDPSRWAKIA